MASWQCPKAKRMWGQLAHTLIPDTPEKESRHVDGHTSVMPLAGSYVAQGRGSPTLPSTEVLCCSATSYLARPPSMTWACTIRTTLQGRPHSSHELVVIGNVLTVSLFYAGPRGPTGWCKSFHGSRITFFKQPPWCICVLPLPSGQVWLWGHHLLWLLSGHTLGCGEYPT